MHQLSHRHARWTVGAVGMLVAAVLTLSQQTTLGQQSQGRRVGRQQRVAHSVQSERQIDASNVTRLGQAWSFDIPGGNNASPGGGNQEATLLAANGVLYGITTWSVVYAVDARTGRQLWRWDPEVNRPEVQEKLCCGVVNRGVAL